MAELLTNNVRTTLAASITSGDLTLDVVSATGFPATGNFRILIDSEILLATARTGTTVTVTRAQESTSAASHASGADVVLVLTAGSLAQYVTDQTASFVTASSAATFTNKSGNISQWTNDSAYLTASSVVSGVTNGQVLVKSGGVITGSPELRYDDSFPGFNYLELSGLDVDGDSPFLWIHAEAPDNLEEPQINIQSQTATLYLNVLGSAYSNVGYTNKASSALIWTTSATGMYFVESGGGGFTFANATDLWLSLTASAFHVVPNATFDGTLSVTGAITQNSVAVVTETGSQTLTNKTLTTPTIGSFTNAGHNHQDAAGGGTLAEAALALTDVTTNNATASAHGFLPKLSGSSSDVLKGDGSWASAGGGGDAFTSNPLSQFAATTSLQLKGVISDETGSGALVFADTPTIVTPTIASFTNATHDHTNAAGGGTLTVAALSDLTSSTLTFTNKRITKRVVTESDATSITPNADTSDVTYQANTQSAGTLTVNAPTGTPTNGQPWLLKLKSTNAQTFSWNAAFAGGTTALPTASSGSSKIDYYAFIYDTVNSKWHYTGSAVNF